MRVKQVLFCGVLLLAFDFGAVTFAAAPGKSELKLRRQWVKEHFDDKPGALPFTFTYDGRPSSNLLANWKLERGREQDQSGRVRRRISCTDPATGLRAECEITEFEQFPAVEWVVCFTNRGKRDTPILENVLALDAAVPAEAKAEVVVQHAIGERNSGESFAPAEDVLGPQSPKPLVFAPVGGRSSDGVMPFFNLCRPDGGVALAIGWSGQWEARFRRTGSGAVAVQAGQQLLRCVLHPGESIRTPRMLLVFWEGADAIRGNNLFRQLLIAHYLPRRNGELVFPPICGSVNWAAPDGSYEEPHVSVMRPLAKRGVEVFWSDMDPQQWYPKGFPEGTGTWEPDLKKYPGGLKPIGDAARAAGLGYLLWFEPERVHTGTRIDRQHPEWVMPPEKEWSRLFRLHDPQARRWLTDYIDTQISAAQLQWLRWDFNIEPLGFWRRNDTPDRQGITENQHVVGLYAMWDELRARHPGLVIDLCASGGRRIDLEALMRGLPLWHSDLQCSGKPSLTADQLQNAGLWRWVPMHGCGNFAYEPSYAFRSAMTAGNILAPCNAAGRFSLIDADMEATVARTIAVYRKLRPYMLGDFYPLFPHSGSEEAWFGYQFHRADLNAGVAVLFRREKSAHPTMPVGLRAIEQKRTYEISWQDVPEKQVLRGDALGALPVKIGTAPGSAIVYYKGRGGRKAGTR